MVPYYDYDYDYTDPDTGLNMETPQRIVRPFPSPEVPSQRYRLGSRYNEPTPGFMTHGEGFKDDSPTLMRPFGPQRQEDPLV